MNSLKTMTLVAVMAAVAYGVYASLHKKPAADPPPGVAENWSTEPQVEMPQGSTAASAPAAAGLPQFLEANPAGPNPLLPPGSAASVAPQAATVHPPLGSQVTAGTMAPEAATAATAAGDTAIGAAALPPTGAGALSAAGPSPFPAASIPQAVYPSTAGAESKPLTDPAAAAAGAKPDDGFAVAVAGDATTPGTSTTPAGGSPALQNLPSGEMNLEFAKAYDAACVQADLGDLAQAHLDLSKWYDRPQLSAAEQQQLMEMLDRLAGTVLYSHQHHLLEKAYQVQPGDTLQRIADSYQVPWQLLAKINGVADPDRLQPGESLKVLRGPFNAVVDLANHRLTLFLAGRYAGRFSIGVGRDHPIAPGDYEVRAVVDNPVYRGSDMVVMAGDPNNPLGRYWIDLGNQLGIHGTNDPRSVGRDDARGCLCLAKEDLEHLHDILSVGSKVVVRR